MTKQEFCETLKYKLSWMPESEANERVSFYNEMISDLMEEGLSEDEAVAKIGEIDGIAQQIIRDTPPAKIEEKPIPQKKSNKALTAILLTVGSPIWAPIAIAGFAIAVSLYAVLWALIVSCWSIFLCLGVCSLAAAVMGVFSIFKGDFATGFAATAVGTVLAGLSILAFFGCEAATKGVIRLTKKIFSAIKKPFKK